MINDREVFRKDQRLTLADGTLAGADLEMPRALAVMIDSVRDDLTAAVARATSVPAALLRESGNLGRIGDTLQAPLYFENGFSKPLSIFCV
jgi:N-acetylglucosamine-6-phosphate deacetylase